MPLEVIRLADREKAILGLECCLETIDDESCPEICPYYSECMKYKKRCIFQYVMKDALALLKAQENEWIPFVKRPLTEEEQWNHPDWCFILDGKVPDDEQEILLYRPWKNKDGYIIEIDRYLDNGDTVYLEGAMDIENGMFWMPLPEPPKEEEA